MNRIAEQIKKQADNSELESIISKKVTKGLIEIVSDVLKEVDSNVTAEDILFTVEGKNAKEELIKIISEMINKK